MDNNLQPEKATFSEFFDIYAKMMLWQVPPVHYILIDCLGERVPYVLNTLLIKCFRGFSKSTIVGVWCAWLLYQDPTLRLLVISGDIKKAGKMLKHVRAILDRHPLTVGFTGKDLENSATAFRIYGNPDERSSSMTCYGITSNMTATRADKIIYDDIETPKNSNTEGKREALEEIVAETFYLLAPDKREQIFVGTPHTKFTIYDKISEQGCTLLEIPLIEKLTGSFPNFQGETAWPVIFTPEYLKHVQIKSKTEAMFLAQYQLQNLNLNESGLDTGLLCYYNDEPRLIKKVGMVNRLYLGEKLVVAVSPFWDVSANRKDASVLAITYITSDGHYYLHRGIHLKGGILDQCPQIHKIIDAFYLKSIRVETNGVGLTAPALLREELKYSTCSVLEHYETQNKYNAIMEAFTIPLSAQLIHVHQDVVEESLLLGQMTDLRPTMVDPDDYVDAFAKSISLEPIRLYSPADAESIRKDMSGDWRPINRNLKYQAKRDHGYNHKLGKRRASMM